VIASNILMAIIKKRLNLKHSLCEIPRVLDLNMAVSSLNDTYRSFIWQTR
jgi:hypothetical protein